MTVAEDLETLQLQSELEEIEFPPGDLESKEAPLESYLHLQQLLLLMKCLDWLWQERTDYFAAGNLTIYYSSEQKKTENFRGPDFFVVLNTERKPRKSWVVWEEGGKYPNVIIELLSNSTANIDKTTKKEIYQDIFRTPEYFLYFDYAQYQHRAESRCWFSPETLEFQGFEMIHGKYEEKQPNEHGQFWSQQLQLFLGIYQQQLRFFTPEGVLVPTPEESAQAERQKNERLAAKLRELNIDPDTL